MEKRQFRRTSKRLSSYIKTGDNEMTYKVYERLELRGIEPFNTLIGSFRYSKDAEIFLDAKQKETYDNNTVRKSFFIFTETD